MWSVVEKTALAEAEVEYEDYVSDHGVGEVSGRLRAGPIGTRRSRRRLREIRAIARSASLSFGRRRRGRSPAIARSASRRKLNTALYEVTDAPDGELGEERRPSVSCRKACNRVLRAGASYCLQDSFAAICRRDIWTRLNARIRSQALTADIDFVVPLLRGRSCHRRHRHRLRSHRAGPWPRRLRRLDSECARA